MRAVLNRAYPSVGNDSDIDHWQFDFSLVDSNGVVLYDTIDIGTVRTVSQKHSVGSFQAMCKAILGTATHDFHRLVGQEFASE
ncbi:hypothetical protein ASG35_11835 [Burkholderia sp. Leaf177]|uniref:hypothetical protein n=1 Tax=Burkholderia sp. Leaf177 TaxID=1736287 RepID=UPI0006F2DA69|nr:hypothetical protein [Burkholderia sp. Leaf177]KQR76968.1 hypothetical protein ASG35_11835 [Burkholderia sp. Leaf177]